MANLTFLDAIGEMQRRSAISGRPAEKTAMDKLLRDNAIRRLSTRGVDAISPAVSEDMSVYSGEGGMVPQGIDVGESLLGGQNAPNTPNALS